jgi:sugar phosphate isomerase/epimerase
VKKIGFIVEMKDCPDSASLRSWAELARQQGIDGLELLFNTKVGVRFDAALIREALAGTGVEVCACGLWWLNTIDPDPAVRAKNRETMHAFLDMAHEIGCKIAFFNCGEYRPGDTDENIRQLRGELQHYKEYAGAYGITIANYLGHGGNFINSRDILRRALEEIPELNLKLDPVGIIRNMKDDPIEIIKLFGNRLVHFHVKDILRYGSDGFEIEPAVGMGDLRWNAIFALLYHHGYEGYVVIEPHGPLFSVPENRWKHIMLSKRHIEQFMLR